MQQFNLEEWLQDKSRKVCTRDGRPARIVCTDLKNGYPIIAAIKEDNSERPYYYDINGKCLFYDSKDIFFADEEEELTEFEKELEKFRTHILATSGEKYDKNGECVIKKVSKNLLDLARKEILKDLPKWKKANVFVSNEFGLATRDGDLIITHNGYQIKLSDLETLPKEE